MKQVHIGASLLKSFDNRKSSLITPDLGSWRTPTPPHSPPGAREKGSSWPWPRPVFTSFVSCFYCTEPGEIKRKAWNLLASLTVTLASKHIHGHTSCLLRGGGRLRPREYGFGSLGPWGVRGGGLWELSCHTRHFIYFRKAVLHLHKCMFHVHLSECSADLR